MSGVTVEWVLVASLAAQVACFAWGYSRGKREGIATATRIIRDDLANGPGLVSAKGIVAELDKGLAKMGAKP